MALPLVGFIILIAIAIASFFFGLSRENVNAGFAFAVFAGILMLSTGMIVMTEGGIDIGKPTEFVTSGDTVSVNYNIENYDVDSWNWVRVVTDSIFWSGFVLIIIGFVYNFKKSRFQRRDEWAI